MTSIFVYIYFSVSEFKPYRGKPTYRWNVRQIQCERLTKLFTQSMFNLCFILQICNIDDCHLNDSIELEFVDHNMNSFFCMV